MKKSIIFALVLLLFAACSSGSGDALDIRSEKDLSGLTLATSNGSFYHLKYAKQPDINLFLTNSESDAIQAVRQNLADVYVGDEVILTTEALKNLSMRKAFRGVEAFDVAFGLSKDNDKLRNQLNAFLETLPIKAIAAHWIEGAPEVEEAPYTIQPDAKPLTCICGVNLSPISYIGEGGEWKGIDCDILRRFAHSLGRPFDMKFQEYGSAFIALQTGQVEVLSGFIFITEERQKSVDFTIPYYQCRPGYFVNADQGKGGISFKERIHLNLLAEKRWLLIAKGLGETLMITVLSILLGTVLGAGVCACRRNRRAWVRKTAELYSDFINGIPMLVLLLILYYIVFAGTGISATIVAVFTFAMYFASSSGNIFNTAISSVPVGQTEAGLSLGFTPLKTFLGIVFPQAWQKALPLYSAECISLLKNTSIVGYIAIADLTRASDLIRSRTFDALIPLLVITIIYFLLAWLISKVFSLIAPKHNS